MPVKTSCPYCGVGCGVIADRDASGAVTVRGDPLHPANFGRLCGKGSALAETIGLEGRLLAPVVNGQEASWDAALDHVAEGFGRIVREHGPDSVAFYVSGQILTEDYYVINKLAKGFIGTANIDTNSRLCMASSVAGHKRAFGSDTVPGCYEDLETADLLVLVGSNAAWCHPILYQRMVAAKANNPACRIVVIDPRRTATCDGADLHLPLRSGSDSVLFNGLLAHLASRDAIDSAFVDGSTTGAEAALRQVAGQTVAQTAEICGLAEGAVALFFDWFAKTERVVTLYSQGVNQSSSGVDKVNAIINCHLLTGRIGRPGMGPFSLTGQPNAMGGREVGGLANQLAAHMEIENPQHRDIVQRFWQSPIIADKQGLKAVDMFDAIADRRIKAVWIMSTNPLVSLPDADRVRRALDACELVVVSDCMRHTDTTRHAHVLLPALTWGEKDGTVTNSERRISRQRRFLPAPGAARADWQTVCDVAQRMGFSGFDYPNAAAIFREHARLSSFENEGTRDFDLSALNTLDDRAYDALTPIQWPVTREYPTGTPRMFETGKILHGRPQGAFRAGDAACRRERDQPGLSAGAQYRAGPRSMAHHDADGKIGAAAGARFRALRRIPSRRCTHGRRREWRARATDQSVGRDGGARCRHRRTAARLRVRADALERRVCRRRPGQRAGQSSDRSDLRAAGVQAHAGQGGSLLAEMACVHSQPPGDRASRSGLLGRRAFRDLLADGTHRRRAADELARLGAGAAPRRI